LSEAKAAAKQAAELFVSADKIKHCKELIDQIEAAERCSDCTQSAAAAAGAVSDSEVLPVISFAPASAVPEPPAPPAPELDHLREANQKLSQEKQSLEDVTKCVVCLDAQRQNCFLPCGHVCACIECAKGLANCPLCTQHIASKVRVYF
jgi:hypothetical protein